MSFLGIVLDHEKTITHSCFGTEGHRNNSNIHLNADGKMPNGMFDVNDENLTGGKGTK